MMVEEADVEVVEAWPWHSSCHSVERVAAVAVAVCQTYARSHRTFLWHCRAAPSSFASPLPSALQSFPSRPGLGPIRNA